VRVLRKLASKESKHRPVTGLKQLSEQLEVGDFVFTHLTALPFAKVSSATLSWANHVGIVVDVSGKQPIIAESRVPLTTTTTLSRFINRSKAGRVAVRRLNSPLTTEQKNKIALAVNKRKWRWYDTGFNLYSNRQFCSRYVREILAEATGVSVGEIENFQAIFKNNPHADLKFWTLWYFGKIPWQRETVTPGSLLNSNVMLTLFDGTV
jgi:hypothetical protein